MSKRPELLLSTPDYSKSSFIRRWFNGACDWLESLLMGAHNLNVAPLRNELGEGYQEIADHAKKMREKYEDDYIAAEAVLRMRHTHLDVPE